MCYHTRRKRAEREESLRREGTWSHITKKSYLKCVVNIFNVYLFVSALENDSKCAMADQVLGVVLELANALHLCCYLLFYHTIALLGFRIPKDLTSLTFHLPDDAQAPRDDYRAGVGDDRIVENDIKTQKQPSSFFFFVAQQTRETSTKSRRGLSALQTTLANMNTNTMTLQVQ